jgi:hypothetical protein
VSGDEDLTYDFPSFDEGSEEMLGASEHLSGAAGESAGIQGRAGAQLRQWLPTAGAADTIDDVEATADQALSQATDITGDDASKLLTQKQNMLDTEHDLTTRINGIGSDPALPETGGADDIPTEDTGGPTPGTTGTRTALSDEEGRLLAQRRDALAADNPDDYDVFSKDPDHFSKKTGYRITDGARDEAKTALDLRDQDKLPSDIQRPPRQGEGDFYSPSEKKYYDIKEIDDTPPREFNAPKMEESITRQLEYNKRTPIIDTRGASQSAIDKMEEFLNSKGWENRVIWYP